MADTYCIPCTTERHPRTAAPGYEEAYDDYVSLLRAHGSAPQEEYDDVAERITFDRERNPIHPIYSHESWDRRLYCCSCTAPIKTALERVTCPDCDFLVPRGELDFHYDEDACGNPNHWTVLRDDD